MFSNLILVQYCLHTLASPRVVGWNLRHASSRISSKLLFPIIRAYRCAPNCNKKVSQYALLNDPIWWHLFCPWPIRRVLVVDNRRSFYQRTIALTDTEGVLVFSALEDASRSLLPLV